MAQGRRWAAGLVAVAALAGLTGACSNFGGGGDDGEAASVRLPAADEAAGSVVEEAEGAAVASGAGGGTNAGTDLGAPLPQGLGTDRVVKTASLEVEVADGGFASAFSKVATVAAANGGFVARSSTHQDGDDAGRQSAGSAVVRVPSANFDQARQQLIDLGDLRSQQLEGEDVGGRLTDLEARLRNLRSHEEAIRLLMTKAVNVGETIEVQRQLSGVREQIEQLASEQARLSDAVAYSTITLSLAEPGIAFNPDGDGSPIGDALARAVDGAQDVVATVIVGLGYLLPLALLAGAAYAAVRLVSRRQEQAVTPAP